MSGTGRSAIGLAIGFVALMLPGSAPAAVQIGQTFSPEACDGGTYLQSGSPGNQYAAPSDGVLTSWSFQAGPAPPQLRFKVARPTGEDNRFTIVGQSELQTSLAPNALNKFPIQIPVEAGDVIGFFVAVFGACAREEQTGYLLHSVAGDQAPGTAATYSAGAGDQLDLSATLEPDCDGDGQGDETQDPSISSCHPRGVALDANKNKVKKGKRVTLAGRITETRQGGACAANQPIELQRKRPKKTTFATIEQLQTDAAAAFSAKEKVKKTFEYRALAPETSTCAGQVSNVEKVKVKKPK
jgi:hypothetical protein